MNRRLSVAPMMECTDRHQRYFMRLITKCTLLYTEMINSGAVIKGDRHYLLDYDPSEHPLALQLGGSDPKALRKSAGIAFKWGYDEVNLNVGCPSDRVQSGAFGACLMATPQLVGDCVKSMQDKAGIPVTVKCRIGIDDMDHYEHLQNFVETVHAGGCNVFIVHARKAILQGLSPKENREIPPLNYERVYRLKRDFPELEIIINGGVKSLEEAAGHLRHVDGVMIGREAYSNPYMMAGADQLIFGQVHNQCQSPQYPPDRHTLLQQYLSYIDDQMSNGTPVRHLTRHLFGLFHGLPGARRFRRYLSENLHRPGAGPALIETAANLVPKVAVETL